MTAETLTLTRAAALARPLGYTIRREPEAGEIVAYAKGTGKNAPAAYFTGCPVDALATVCSMAADSADPEALKAAREACGVPMTRAERREAGHAAELAADSTAGLLNRAAHYDRAAELFEPLGGHYAARAATCREAAQRCRQVQANADSCASVTENPEARAADPLGEIVAECDRMAADTPREEAQPETPREAFTIDATPTWASLAPAFVMALQNGTPEGQQIAREEMARGFAALDAHNARARAIADSLETARLFLAAFPEAPETLTRAELARRFVDARETLAAIVDAA